VTTTATHAPTLEELGHLARARELAMNGRGRVSPNPLVGAIVLNDGRVVGTGWHEGPGTPHAEVVALREAGGAGRGATVVCTLEPCSHHGRTPPCTDAIIAAGVARVVIGCLDPLERGREGGATVLAEAGVDVAIAPGDDADACRELNAAFVTHALTSRPLVTLKLATSLDGKVATATGETRWISGPESRTLVHRWRADMDGVAVGIGTVLADDPLLNVRDVGGSYRPPSRIVFDRHARLPLDSRLVAGIDEAPVIVVAAADAPAERVERLEDAGVDVIRTGVPEGADPIGGALEALGARDIQSLLLEGGPILAEAFLARDAVDRVAWFVAPLLIGGAQAPGALGGRGLGRLAEVPRLQDISVERVGDDVLIAGRLRQLAGTRS
jgi:diaminohydroxyphosphoribosylaminopyrimidine deaminase/5-amino-6-(5-phosphoribosylamino)uracil reductase